VNQIMRLAILQKHAKNFVASPQVLRPMFEGIHFDEKGRGIVTDTHQLVIVDDVHQYPEPITIHHKTGEVIEGPFPDADKVIPQKFKTEITIFEDLIPSAAKNCLKQLITYHKIAEMVSSDSEQVKYVLDKERLWLRAKSGVTEGSTFSVPLPLLTLEQAINTFEILFNPRFMINVLSLLIEFQPSSLKLGFNGPLSAITILTNVGVTAIVSPIRLPEEE